MARNNMTATPPARACMVLCILGPRWNARPHRMSLGCVCGARATLRAAHVRRARGTDGVCARWPWGATRARSMREAHGVVPGAVSESERGCMYSDAAHQKFKAARHCPSGSARRPPRARPGPGPGVAAQPDPSPVSVLSLPSPARGSDGTSLLGRCARRNRQGRNRRNYVVRAKTWTTRQSPQSRHSDRAETGVPESGVSCPQSGVERHSSVTLGCLCRGVLAL